MAFPQVNLYVAEKRNSLWPRLRDSRFFPKQIDLVGPLLHFVVAFECIRVTSRGDLNLQTPDVVKNQQGPEHRSWCH